MSCADGWEYDDSEVNGVCPECGMPTVDGIAQEGCFWSPVECEVCESAPCNGDC